MLKVRRTLKVINQIGIEQLTNVNMYQKNKFDIMIVQNET